MLQLVTEYSGSSTNKLLPLLITKQKESRLLTSNFTCDDVRVSSLHACWESSGKMCHIVSHGVISVRHRRLRSNCMKKPVTRCKLLFAYTNVRVIGSDVLGHVTCIDQWEQTKCLCIRLSSAS